ncbi:MAG TPA: protein kinase [Nitriliruptorales bacterium]|nr:protein kinase [Nitriliruptorales bacterium]
MVQAGEVLAGRYELRERLSRGGMAEVFAARDRVLDRRVAVKVLSPQLVGDASFLERFRREARSAAALNHARVVAVHDTGADGNTHFIVMELVEGPTLRAVIEREAPLDPRRAAEVTRQVCAALGAAHTLGIVHRDIKPANIMFTPQGEVKVADFGIARAMATATQTDTVYGSALYIAPEQARGEEVDPRADIYALGAVLYEMLTGRPPFTGDSSLAVVYQHLHKQPAPPSELVDGVPSWLDDLALRMLAKDRNRRYGDVDEVRDDLDRGLRGEPVAAAPTVLAQDLPGSAGTGGQGPLTGRAAARDRYERVVVLPTDGGGGGAQRAIVVVAVLAAVLLLTLFLLRTIDWDTVSGGGAPAGEPPAPAVPPPASTPPPGQPTTPPADQEPQTEPTPETTQPTTPAPTATSPSPSPSPTPTTPPGSPSP